jgi:hypothetical protein
LVNDFLLGWRTVIDIQQCLFIDVRANAPVFFVSANHAKKNRKAARGTPTNTNYFSIIIPSFNFLSDVLITKMLFIAFKLVTAKFGGKPLPENSHLSLSLVFL